MERRSRFKAGVSAVLSFEGSFDYATRSFTSFRTSLQIEILLGAPEAIP